jgi:TetR/AcrR family transcriptional regulator, transcriptional repressor for nem operon
MIKQLDVGSFNMKNKILELAAYTLRTGGYEALNFGTISEQLNISRANIHYHFQSKENLALEAVNQYMVNVENKLRHLSQHHAGDCHAILQSLDDELWMKLTEDEYQGFCMCLNIVVGQSWMPQILKDRAIEHFEHLVESFERVIGDAQASGLISKRASAKDLAREAMLIHFGIAQLAIALPSEREVGSFSRRYMKQWIDLLLNSADSTLNSSKITNSISD